METRVKRIKISISRVESLLSIGDRNGRLCPARRVPIGTSSLREGGT